MLQTFTRARLQINFVISRGLSHDGKPRGQLTGGYIRSREGMGDVSV